MRKVLATIAATTFLAVAAYAGEVQGVVQSVDTENRIITLEDGTQITADAAVDLEALASGDKVTESLHQNAAAADKVCKACHVAGIFNRLFERFCKADCGEQRKV